MEAVEPRLGFCSGGQGGSPSPPPGHRPSPSRAATPALFVRPQEPGHFGAQQFDEGPWEHLLGLLGCVLEVVLGMGQHVEESLDQLLVLQGKAGVVRPRPEARLAWRAPAPYRCLWGGL